jgi:hypothetical protein
MEYVDHQEEWMEEELDGSGRFRSVTLKPTVTITRDSDLDKAHALAG